MRIICVNRKAEFEKIDVNELVKKRLIIEDFKVPRTTEVRTIA